MGHSQAEKAQNRERILAEAAQQIRREGLESVSVGALMKKVGLTHGGFYGHFESRSALLAEALERALQEGQAKVSGSMRFADLVRGYLSRSHRDARDSGCAMAALACDVGRADLASREAMTGYINGFVDDAAAGLDGDRERAMMAVSALVGALALSRVIADPGQSDAFLRTVRDHLSRLEF
ncbi:MAG: TetR/AcrR family transcriptional regulator [Caulobacterales bacterium]|nr:TetR/AcrR family transcriptional regulator [Caulobacterales bacterium]